MRIRFSALLLLLAPLCILHAQTLDPALNLSTVVLWPDGAPEAKGTTDADIPTLTVFAPRPGKANGTSVILAPGGAYRHLAADLEGREVADWFASRGVTAFVLRYRLAPRYAYPIPLVDAERAVRWVRANAAKYGLVANRIGIMGFSAGGHLAAMESVSGDAGKPDASDPVERVSSRPDFQVLGYAWLNAMQPNTKKLLNYCVLFANDIPADRCATFAQLYTPTLHVTVNTPPAFLYMTTDDRTVPVESNVAYYSALHEAGVSAEMHLFRHGAHGSGLGSGDAALDQWPTLLEQWLRDQGFLTAPPPAPVATK